MNMGDQVQASRK